MKKRFYSCLLALLFASCLTEEELSMKNMGEVSDYFIECYCRPGTPFSLTISKVIPISQLIKPDFSILMDISITAGTPVTLSLVRPTYINNYGTKEVFRAYGIDSLYLNITTPEQKKITAKTMIPSDITINEATIEQHTATIHFQTSRDAAENYYIYTLQLIQADTLLKREVSYLDCITIPNTSTRHAITSFQMKEAEYVVFSLKRITRECYNYQISLNEANSTQQGSITSPIPLNGNINGSLGIFTCYTQAFRAFQLKEGAIAREVTSPMLDIFVNRY